MNDRVRKRASPEVETLQRVRRIETRLTSLLIANGIGTEARSPVFEAGPLGKPPKLYLPSPHSSTKEVLSAIPDEFRGVSIQLYVGDTKMGCVIRD